MLTMMPLAPSIEESSSSGFEIARWAASVARFSPWPTPVPITAWPIPFITARTSAKSRLIWPGTVMMSEMPCTAWRSTSSATRKASVTGVLRATEVSRRSLGIAITESTHSRSWPSPSSACAMRRLPSSANGSVTTATDSTLPVSPPSWLAIDATTGAAPVPVPPPRPGGDEDHVGALERVADLLGVLDRGLAADVGVGAGAEALGELAADLDLDRGAVRSQRLQVGVDRDELDALQPRRDHPAHRVSTTPTHAHHLDAGAVDLLLGKLDAARTVGLFGHAPQIPSEQPVMNPQWRQMRLQWYATTAAPHISHGKLAARRPSERDRAGRAPRAGRPRAAAAVRRLRASFPCPLPQKKSDSQPMRRPVTRPNVPVAA